MYFIITLSRVQRLKLYSLNIANYHGSKDTDL